MGSSLYNIENVLKYDFLFLFFLFAFLSHFKVAHKNKQYFVSLGKVDMCLRFRNLKQHCRPHRSEIIFAMCQKKVTFVLCIPTPHYI